MAGLRLSAFDVIGPAMIGPSSSHTAGAARIGLIARRLLGEPVCCARLGLHGSFAATGRGHATDRALVAGLLDLAPDDPALPESLQRAAAAGLDVSFAAVDLGDSVHPNTARLELEGATTRLVLTGSSLGGGVIEVTEVDGYQTSFRCNLDAIVCWHADERGFLAKATSLLACVEINIAALRTTRGERGRDALTVLEIDCCPPPEALQVLRRMNGLVKLRHLAPLP